MHHQAPSLLPHHRQQQQQQQQHYSSWRSRSMTFIFWLVTRVDRRIWHVVVINGILFCALLTILDGYRTLRLLVMLNLGVGVYRLVVWPVLEQRRRASLDAVGFLERAKQLKRADMIDRANHKRRLLQQQQQQQHLQRRSTPLSSRRSSPQRRRPPSPPPSSSTAAATAASAVLPTPSQTTTETMYE